MRAKVFSAILAALLTVICNSFAFAQGGGSPLQLNFDFRNGSLGWQAGFADYNPSHESIYDLRADIRNLPPELGLSGTGFYFQGHNRSDDLFMFMKRRLTRAEGIVAGQRYEVYYTLVFASNACSDCGGIGGHPGLSVYLKAGASPIEPIPFLDLDGHVRLNVDIGAQSNGGIAATVTGGIANGLPYSPSPPYVSIRREYRHLTQVTANSQGELWLLIGTDSGFEGLTQLYYQGIEVRLVPVGSSPPAPAPTPGLLIEENTERAIALNAVTLTREPFTLITSHNLSLDLRTRVLLFATNLELLPGENASAVSAQIEDAQQRVIQVPVEFVGKVPSFDWLTQIVARLPSHLPENTRELRISINLRGSVSNSVSLSFTPRNNPP